MTAIEPTTPSSTTPGPAAAGAAAAGSGTPTVSVVGSGTTTVSVATPAGTALAVPPVVVNPAAPGSSTTTVVYVNPPATPALPGSGPTGLPRASRKSASLLTAYALFFFFGWTGMHQVYLGNTLRGVSYIFTFSWFTLALWIDLFTLPSQVRRVNTERMLGLR